MKTLKKNNISQGSSINSPVPVNKNCELPPFFNEDYFGHVVVQTIEELNSIPCKLRQDGMVATVVQDSYAEWQLQSSRIGFSKCDNNAWVKISNGDEVFNGGNLFLFQTEEQANEFMSSTQSKEGQIIYISDLDRYFKFDGQDGLTDAFPNKLDKPTVQGLDNPNYKIPAYLDGKPYWRSSSDFGKVDTVNGIEPDGNKNVDLGIDDILPKGMPLEETLDDNKKVLLYDDTGKSYWKSLSEVGKVKSVNRKEGDVVLKTSDLQNDSDYTTNAILTAHTSNKANPHNVTKSQIGLGDVDNTSDLNKPISTTTQIELDKKVNKPTINNTPDYVLLADGSTAPKSDFGKVNSVNGIDPDTNKNIKVGINEILKEYQPNIVADKNKKVLLFDEDGKTYYFNLGDIMTNTAVDESLFVNVDNLLGVNTTSAITEKVINNFENITYPIDISLDYNYTEITDIFINSCLKLPRDYYYIISNNRIKIKDFSDLINTENWEKLFIEITGTKNTNYEQ